MGALDDLFEADKLETEGADESKEVEEVKESEEAGDTEKEEASDEVEDTEETAETEEEAPEEDVWKKRYEALQSKMEEMMGEQSQEAPEEEKAVAVPELGDEAIDALMEGDPAKLKGFLQELVKTVKSMTSQRSGPSDVGRMISSQIAAEMYFAGEGKELVAFRPLVAAELKKMAAEKVNVKSLTEAFTEAGKRVRSSLGFDTEGKKGMVKKKKTPALPSNTVKGAGRTPAGGGKKVSKNEALLMELAQLMED